MQSKHKKTNCEHSRRKSYGLQHERIIYKDDIKFITDFQCLLGHTVCTFLNKPSVVWFCAETWLKLSILVNLHNILLVCVKFYVLRNTFGFARITQKQFRKTRKACCALCSKDAQKFANFVQKIWSFRGNPILVVDLKIMWLARVNRYPITTAGRSGFHLFVNF